MIAGIDPRVDYAFKRIFGSDQNVAILSDFLHAVLKPDRRIVELVLLNPFNEKDFANDKLSILDIKARDEIGQQYNVEMQLFGSHIQLNRILYYWAKLHAGQLRDGLKYTTLRPTVSITIVNTILFPEVPAYHLDFQLRSREYPQLMFSPHQAIHLLELPKFRMGADALTDPLEVWCYFLKNGVNLDIAHPPKSLQVPLVRKAMEVLEMLSKSDIERECYEARLKWERDQTAFIDEAREEGIKEGIKEGSARGEWIGRIQMGQDLLGIPIMAKEELGRLPIEDLQARARALEQQLRTQK